MYLTLKQHDLFRTLLMGFEIPFRSYVAENVIINYSDCTSFEQALLSKKNSLMPSDPVFYDKRYLIWEHMLKYRKHMKRLKMHIQI